MPNNEPQLGQGELPEDIAPTESNSNNQQNMEALLDQEGLALDFPQPGEIRTGVIASISPNQILVSVGAKSEGVIAGRELESIDADELATLVVGQEILVFVLASEDDRGNVVLSYTRAQEQKGWNEVEKLLEDGGSYDGAVDGFNKGGLIVPLYGLRGFVPASQLSITRRMSVSGDTPDERFAHFIGEPITIRVVEVDRKRRRLILSERAASSETRQSIKERVIESLEEGKNYSGKVTSVADFGAFVNINGADGLVHLSEISWERISHPSEVLEVGQEVQVKVINIDHEKKRIALSIRALQNDPWQKKVEKFKVGQLVEGVITRLTKFGAFARLEGDIEGLIHISEISEARIEHPKEKLHDGDVLTLRIIRIEPDQRRIGLSLRKVDSGAYKDLDFKQLDLEGVVLVGADDEPAGTPEEAASTTDEPQETLETPESTEEAAPGAVEEAPPPPDESPVETTTDVEEEPPVEMETPADESPAEPTTDVKQESPVEMETPADESPAEPTSDMEQEPPVEMETPAGDESKE